MNVKFRSESSIISTSDAGNCSINKVINKKYKHYSPDDSHSATPKHKFLTYPPAKFNQNHMKCS